MYLLEPHLRLLVALVLGSWVEVGQVGIGSAVGQERCAVAARGARGGSAAAVLRVSGNPELVGRARLPGRRLRRRRGRPASTVKVNKVASLACGVLLRPD